jgi:hypothetical protein
MPFQIKQAAVTIMVRQPLKEKLLLKLCACDYGSYASDDDGGYYYPKEWKVV